MRKKLLMAITLLVSGVGNLWADDIFKDVTSIYLTNADFEGTYTVHSNPSSDRAIYKPTGWTINYENGKEWDMTALKNGDLSWDSFSSVPTLSSGGTQTYRIRFNNSYKNQRLEFSQSATLPKSTYKLEANWYISRTDAGDGYIKIGGTRYNASTAGSWQDFSQEFSSTGAAITFVMGAFHSANTEKFYAFDNFKIYWNLTKSLANLITEAEGVYVEGCTLDGMTTMKTALDDAKTYKDSTDPDVLEAKYNALNNALPLAVAAKTYWTAKTNGQTALDNTKDYANIVGAERTALENAVGEGVTNSIEWYEAQASAINGARTTFIDAKTNYDLNAAEVTRATALGVASGTIETYTAGALTTSAAAATNVQALKVAEYTYVTTNYEHALTLAAGDWSASTITEEKTSNWNGKNEYYKASNGYGLSSWNSSFSQTFDLQAGVYIFMVAGRRSTNSAMWIEVKDGETELGKTNDFPQASTGLGINTSGETDFTTGEGHTYANGGSGYGWEWRYVKFTLAAKTTVTVAIKGSAGASSQWINFSGYQVLATSDVNASFYEYYKSLNKATAALENATYNNVQGTDRSGLVTATEADPGSTTTTIDAAKSALDAAYSTFTNADGLTSWNGYALAKSYSDAAASLDYATAAKIEAVTTARDATVNTAADALTQTATIYTANRQAYESHALAEGVSNRQTIAITDANMDVTYDSSKKKFGAWQVFGQTDGTIALKDATYSLTDGDGNATYKYADIWKSDNNAGIKQSVSLAPGKYMLTVSARADDTAGAAFWVFAGVNTNSIDRLDTNGGVFGRGWNDASVEFTVATQSDVEIGVQSGNGKDLWWSATRFRLVRIGDAATMTVKDGKWGTFVAPFAVAIPADIEAYKVTGVSGSSVTTEEVTTTIPANTPVVLKNNKGEDYSGTFYGAIHSSDDCTEGLLTGVYTAATIAASDGDNTRYVLQTQEDVQAFYKVTSDFTASPNRCYLTVPVASGVKAFYLDGDETAVSSVKADELQGATIYNLAGQRVSKAQKGVYIINGKKVAVK